LAKQLLVEALKKEGGLWNRWEVLALSINQSQLRVRHSTNPHSGPISPTWF